nr:poly(ADP ribose) glycohydrolase ARH3 [Hymenolepis microstoma]
MLLIMMVSVYSLLQQHMERFIRGSLYGSIFGDACGAPFELKSKVPLGNVLKFFNERLSGKKADVLNYTDDSEMALCICESLKRSNGFNASDLAKTFSDTYDCSPPCRLYGGSIGGLFAKMRAKNFVDPASVAAAQFNGSGSYGNGGGMRITPAAIYGLNLGTAEFNKLICDITSITHTNPLALYGALLQAHALRRIITLSSKYGAGFEINTGLLIHGLVEDLANADLSAYAFGHSHNFHKKAYQQFLEKMSTVQEFITQDQRPSVEEVVSKLGNGEPAIEAIPTALYVFLQCLKPMTEIPYEDLMIKCSVYASTLGYDTDTIGCMACAIAGAYLGAEKIERDTRNAKSTIPIRIFRNIEGLETINEYCDWLIQHVNRTQ